MEKILKVVLTVMLLISVAMAIGAFATGGANGAINAAIIWSYFLVAFGVAAAIACSVFSMIQAPAGVKSAIISVVAVVAIIGISYGIASSSPKQILNIADGTFFNEGDTLITDVSILVTYVAMGGAILVSLFGELMGVYNSYMKSSKPKAEKLEA
ncbi:MAG: hypothetical protein SNG35_04380 [Rikenellaceae bacterium]